MLYTHQTRQSELKVGTWEVNPRDRICEFYWALFPGDTLITPHNTMKRTRDDFDSTQHPSALGPIYTLHTDLFVTIFGFLDPVSTIITRCVSSEWERIVLYLLAPDWTFSRTLINKKYNVITAALRNQWHSVRDWAFSCGCPMDGIACYESVGDVSGITWLEEHNQQFRISAKSSKVGTHAASIGDLAVIEHLLQPRLDHSRPPTNNILREAASHGHLHIIKWLVASNFESLSNVDTTTTIIVAAAAGGHLVILEWIFSYFTICPELAQFCPKGAYHMPIIGHAMSQAIMGGHFNILQWLELSGELEDNIRYTIETNLFVYQGSAFMLKSFLQVFDNIQVSNSILAFPGELAPYLGERREKVPTIIKTANLEMLDFIMEISPDSIRLPGNHPDLALLQIYLQRLIVYVDTPEVLQWFKSKDFDFSPIYGNLALTAIKYNKLDILMWVVEEVGGAEPLQQIIYNRNYNVIQFDASVITGTSPWLSTLEWLLDNHMMQFVPYGFSLGLAIMGSPDTKATIAGVYQKFKTWLFLAAPVGNVDDYELLRVMFGGLIMKNKIAVIEEFIGLFAEDPVVHYRISWEFIKHACHLNRIDLVHKAWATCKQDLILVDDVRKLLRCACKHGHFQIFSWAYDVLAQYLSYPTRAERLHHKKLTKSYCLNKAISYGNLPVLEFLMRRSAKITCEQFADAVNLGCKRTILRCLELQTEKRAKSWISRVADNVYGNITDGNDCRYSCNWPLILLLARRYNMVPTEQEALSELLAPGGLNFFKIICSERIPPLSSMPPTNGKKYLPITAIDVLNTKYHSSRSGTSGILDTFIEYLVVVGPTQPDLSPAYSGTFSKFF